MLRLFQLGRRLPFSKQVHTFRMAAASSSDSTSIVDNLGNLLQEIDAEKKKHNTNQNVTLVAVSKTKPLSMITQLYDSKYNHRHFGENYVTGKNALKEKAAELAQSNKYNQIKWHYIGHIQSNDIKKLVEVPNLWMIETLDNEKHCKKLNDRYKLHIESNKQSQNDHESKTNDKQNTQHTQLRVMIQIKSPLKDKSIKDTKSGIEYPDPVDDGDNKNDKNNESESKEKENENGSGDKSSSFAAGKLAKYICNDCDYLQLSGLMTMARQDVDASEDFENLVNCRNDLWKYLNDKNENIKHKFNSIDDIQLSMGMTGDWKQAIAKGSTNLRIGSKIFGARQKT